METWKSRPKRRNVKGWIVAVAAIVLLGTMCALSFNAQMALGAGGKPPTLDATMKAPPTKPNYSLVCRYRPEIVKPALCYRPNSRRPYRPEVRR